MVRWLRWHCPPDTGFEIRALSVWGRTRYLSVTEAPHNTDFHTWMGKKHFCFFQTAETRNRTPNSAVKGSGANHYPRAPAQIHVEQEIWSPHQPVSTIIGLLTSCWKLKDFWGPLHEGIIPGMIELSTNCLLVRPLYNTLKSRSDSHRLFSDFSITHLVVIVR